MAYTTTPPTHGRKPPCYGPHGGIGDVGGDGRVGYDDLAMLKQASINDITLSDKEASRADLDGNGNPADAVDIAAITKYLVNDLDTFPACTKHGYPTTPPTYGRDPPCYRPEGGVGDVGGDGRVASDDQAMIRQAWMGDITLSAREAARADLDGNGKPADSVDIAAMTMYSLGDIDTFPVCEVTTPPQPPDMETRTVSLSEGQHNIQLSLAGYDTLNATINVTASGVTCISVVGGACGGSGLPRVSTSGFTASVYLKASSVASGYDAWVAAKGGATGLRNNLTAIGEIIDGYLSSPGDAGYLGFVVSLADIGTTIDYYLG